MKFKFEIICPFCGCIHYVEAYGEDYERWCEGHTIQSCMPYLSPTEREQFISHLCPDCQKSVFEEL